jgi:tRNA(Arg) A34 adenosine deaminase TadA
LRARSGGHRPVIAVTHRTNAVPATCIIGGGPRCSPTLPSWDFAAGPTSHHSRRHNPLVGLDTAWQRALSLAWQSFLAGTTPVGAVVIGPAGKVVAEGRGRRYEHPEADRRQLAYCHIAHAEINALAGLPPTQHYEDHLLLTTLEPCCMCLGAAVQSTITRVHFAGRDPYGGASGLMIDTPQARRRPMAVTGPLADLRGRFAELLHVRWLLDFGASQPVLEPQQRTIPGIHEMAVRPATSSLFDRLRHDCADVGQAMTAVERLFGCS